MTEASRTTKKHISPPLWKVATAPVPYDLALQFMEDKVAAIRNQEDKDCIWFLEHPPLYTAGTSAKPEDLKEARFPVHMTGRGGQYTYHGPGQRVVYAMMDLQPRGCDLRRHVRDLESWVIAALDDFGVKGERRESRTGIWVDLAPYGRVGEAKIAALGLRVRKWVAYHGFAVNVDCDLSHYAGIVPCGLAEYGVTSLADLGLKIPMSALDDALRRSFPHVFQ